MVGINERDPQIFDLYMVDVTTGERELLKENPGYAAWLIDNALEPGEYALEMVLVEDGRRSPVGETAVLEQLKIFYADIQARHPDQFSLETIRPRLDDRPHE